MRTRSLTLKEAKSLFGQSTTERREGGFLVPKCARNGTPQPHITFVFEEAEIPTVDGRPYNLIQGIRMPDIARELWEGFAGAKLAFGKFVTRPLAEKQALRNLFTLCEPQHATHIFVNYTNPNFEGVSTADEPYSVLAGDAEHVQLYHTDAVTLRAFFVFPIWYSYDQSNPSEGQKSARTLKRRRTAQGNYCRYFDRDVLEYEQAALLTAPPLSFSALCFNDDLIFEATWVVDPEGRCLEPDESEERPGRYCNSSGLHRNEWEEVHAYHLILACRLDSEQKPEQITLSVIQQPPELTARQLHRSQQLRRQIILEHQKRQPNYHPDRPRRLTDSSILSGLYPDWDWPHPLPQAAV